MDANETGGDVSQLRWSPAATMTDEMGTSLSHSTYSNNFQNHTNTTDVMRPELQSHPLSIYDMHIHTKIIWHNQPRKEHKINIFNQTFQFMNLAIRGLPMNGNSEDYDISNFWDHT